MSATREISAHEMREHRMEDEAPDVAWLRPNHLESSQLLRRGVAVIALAGIALVHVVDATGKFHETPYLGWAYVALIVGCVVIAGMLIEHDDRRTWIVVAGISILAFVAYSLSRTTGLPAAKDDIGNWFEPLGLATIFAEATATAVAIRAIAALNSLSRREQNFAKAP
jgi:hypothetical protein